MRVFAKWLVKRLPKDTGVFHIHCGEHTEHFERFLPTDKHAKITAIRVGNHFEVTFSAPSQGLHERCGFWLQPSVHEGVVAHEYGIS